MKRMIIDKTHAMADALLENNRLISLLPRFNIELGFGEKSVETVCRQNNVNTEFFLEIVNSYLNEDYQPLNEIAGFPLSSVVNYLTNTHKIYLETELPGIENQIRQLIQNSSLSRDKKDLVINFFNDYKKEFLDHIMKEEDEVLPYILELEEQSEKTVPDDHFAEKLKSYSILQFAREHDRLENSLANLAALIIKYLPPFNDRTLCNQILTGLFVLKDDLIDHAHMEDKVLVPKVAEMEKELIQRIQS